MVYYARSTRLPLHWRAVGKFYVHFFCCGGLICPNALLDAQFALAVSEALGFGLI